MTFVTNAETNTVKIGMYLRNFNAESERQRSLKTQEMPFPSIQIYKFYGGGGGEMPPDPPNYAKSSHCTLQEKSWICP